MFRMGHVVRECRVHFIVTVTAVWLVSSGAALAAGDANSESCSPFPATEASPGFRSYLPDCRAYELVTPPYAGGQPGQWEFDAPPPISADGNHILGTVFAGFAGTENEEQNGLAFGAIYEFSRTSSGWSAESWEPPASQYARRRWVAASGDLSRSLWKLVSQAHEGEEVGLPETYDFAVRDVAGGRVRFAAVGPGEPAEGRHSRDGSHELRFAGASRDLTHLVFEVNSESKQVWPGDGTREGDRSLYEYVGVGNGEPTLVGVSNAGALEGKTHVNDEAKLVSGCGTILGSGSSLHGSAYNAVSADGAAVYFTALACEGAPAVNELYARISGSQTTAISEPTKANCELCKTGSRAGAVFQGASEDGSRAFFLSEQELLPGAKGRNLYEYDFHSEAGKRVSLVAPEAAGVARVSEDGSHVYFVATSALAATPDLSLAAGHQMPAEHEPNLYVWNTTTGRMAFIGTLSAGDEKIWAQLDSERPVQTTPDGRFLVFTSATQLTPGDSAAVGQVFEYDALAESLVRVSAGQKSAAFPEGYGDNGNTTKPEDAAHILRTPQFRAMRPTDATSALSLAEDGTVVFTSRDALTPGAVLDAPTFGSEASLRFTENVYEYRAGGVYLISPADETTPAQTEMSRLLGTNASGSDVFFFTTDSLVPQDGDTQASWYDARVGGGFRAPPPSGGCAGDACRGPLSAAPPALTVGSMGAAEGGLVPPVSAPAFKPLNNSQKLAEALKVCRAKHRKHRRAVCESQARRRYRPKSKKASTNRKGTR
jgi:hypothetical protein